ncbi:MAG: peptide chain release factor 1 [Bdellovibrionota bacterium]|nr:MAG: peptide chain release factor 1 [Bdellovibrionota bacterium]
MSEGFSLLWGKLQEVERRFEELGEMLARPEVIKDRARFEKHSREYKELQELVATIRAYRKAEEEFRGSKELIENPKSDPELRELAQEEFKLLQAEIEGLEKRLQLMLLPKDPNDSKNVIMEIRAGAGGDEASLFAGELFRMYSRYAERQGWRCEILGTSEGTAGGFKEIIALISGPLAFSRLKYERGVHRVQRVPQTETQGRVHTSTVTVAVLPEAEDLDVQVNEQDLKVEVFRSGGPGGQSVNTTDSAVRMTHVPTGLVVVMRDEKSQTKNRDKALRVLKSRLLDLRQSELEAERSADRRAQLGTGERSEKIRTYNFPQSRVTDHRIGLSLYNVDAVVDGDLDQLIEPLMNADQAAKLQGQSGGLLAAGVEDDESN